MAGERAGKISIHAPRTGSDLNAEKEANGAIEFQSTLPARGATASHSGTKPVSIYFNPRSPHGERPNLLYRRGLLPYFNPRSPHGERRKRKRNGKPCKTISIHAPRMGSDGNSYTQVIRSGRFQSTLPAWGATIEKAQGTLIVFISIHAPRMGSDPSEMFAIAFSRYFNPRSPHGERQAAAACPSWTLYFNPRSPHGERPEGLYSSPFFQHFNPRSPHGERHQADGISASVVGDFNPRSPHGERPAGATGTVYDPEFQSTLPAWGATFTPCPSVDAPKPFQSTLPAWGATSCCMRICAM